MSNSSRKWSAIIYGRTYEVDFRLIAMPEYFDSDPKARTWAENYILATTQIPEKLSGNPRWSLFTNKKYCVFATTCMVKELFPNGISQETNDITTDFRGRPLYAFIGYVAKRDESDESEQFPPLPAYSEVMLEQFQPLYQKYVEQRWDVKPYQPESKEPIPTIEEEEDVRFNLTEISGGEFKLNQDPKKIRLWSEEYQSDLWNTVIQKIKISHKPISVCLGLSTPRDAENSPFLNATVLRLDTSRDGLDLERHINKSSSPKTQTETINLPTVGNQKNENERIAASIKYQHKSVNKTQKKYDSNVLDPKIKKLIFGIVIYYLIDNRGIDIEINNILTVSKVKFQQLEDSLIISYNNLNFEGIYSFFEHEYKQLTDAKKMYDENIQELQKITSLDRTTLESQLKTSMDETQGQDMMIFVNDMLNWVSPYSSKTVIEKEQQESSNKSFGFKTIKPDKNQTNDGNTSKYSKPEANPHKNDEWF